MRSSLKVTWYRHRHENRNDWVRYGLMLMHKDKQISYAEKDLIYAVEAGYNKEVASGTHQHLSFLALSVNHKICKFIIDAEDSFIHLSEFIQEVDVYFTVSYNAELYKEMKFPKIDDWYDENDVAWYKTKVNEIISRFSHQFHKIKPFIPIGPNLSTKGQSSGLFFRKINSFIYKFNKLITSANYWQPDRRNFDKRFAQLLTLRNEDLQYDIVLKDTLWGWPLHRIKLHEQLEKLSYAKKIYAVLNWHEPTYYDGSINKPVDKTQFPMVAGGPVCNYELMLSQSRLGVFATGFHWGWRNIMSLSLFTGIPVLTDSFVLETYFNMDEFFLLYNSSADWSIIGEHLNTIDKVKWLQIKEHNQRVFDARMSPRVTAAYLINTLREGCV